MSPVENLPIGMLFPDPIFRDLTEDRQFRGHMSKNSILPQMHWFMTNFAHELNNPPNRQEYSKIILMLKSGGPLQNIFTQLAGAYAINKIPEVIPADFAEMAEIAGNPWINNELASVLEPGQSILVLDEYQHKGEQEKLVMGTMKRLFPKTNFSFRTAFSEVPYWREHESMMGMQDRTVFHWIEQSIGELFPGKKIQDYKKLNRDERVAVQNRLDKNLVNDAINIDNTLNRPGLNRPDWFCLQTIKPGIEHLPLGVGNQDRTILDYFCYFAGKNKINVNPAKLLKDPYYLDSIYSRIKPQLTETVRSSVSRYWLEDIRQARDWFSQIALAELPFSELPEIPVIIPAAEISKAFYRDIEQNLCPAILEYRDHV